MIEGFSRVTDGQAIVRKPRGVHVQTNIYHRKGQIYINAAGGYIRIGAKFGDHWITTHPDYQVLELDGEGVKFAGVSFAPVFNKGWSK